MNVPFLLGNDDLNDNCFSNIVDCAGVCDGPAVVDSCGVCGGLDSAVDCAGVCFGGSYLDNCGACDSDASNDCVQDCTGEWGGEAFESFYYFDKRVYR